jgi:hypothetical protein
MKTKHLINLAVLTLLTFNGFSQNIQVDLTFNTVVDTTNSTFNQSNGYPIILFTPKEKQDFVNLYSKFSKDKKGTYSTLIVEVDDIISHKETSKYIKTNNSYLEPYNFKNISSPLSGDSIIEYTLIPKIDENGESVYDPETGDEIFIEIMTKKTLVNELKLIETAERWIYKKGDFTKNSNINTLNIMVYDNENKPKALRSVYNKFLTKKSKKGKIFKENLSYNYIFHPLLFDNKSLTEIAKKNDPNYVETIAKKNSEYINELTEFEVKGMLSRIIKDIYSGKLKAYDLNNKPLNINSIDNVFSETISVQKIDEEGEPMYDSETGNEIMTIQKNSYKLSDIIGFNFTEDWYLAKNQFDIIKKVNRISFLASTYNNNGERTGIKKLPCVIKFK